MSDSVHLSKIRNLHAGLVLKRREDVLARQITNVLPAGIISLLDVGCGDSVIAAAMAASRSELKVQGVEVLDREHCAIPNVLFDGQTLPFEDGAFDCVSFVDVLHHTDNPWSLVAEAACVSRRYVVLKDHTCSNVLDQKMLAFMDWVGNRAYGVHLNYNYLHPSAWQEIYARHSLKVARNETKIGLYAFPFSLVFERGKHFVALLEKT